MTPQDLPPLPEPQTLNGCYTLDQMRSYALAAVEAERQKWLPIETMPENTLALTWASWDPEIGISLFRCVKRVEQHVEHESHNAKGRRRIIQEVEVQEREWEGSHHEPTHWMPLPAAPSQE
jgi:hypothetical protein